MKKQYQYKITAFILGILILLLLAGCLIAIYITGRQQPSGQGMCAEIYQDGTLLISIPLNEIEDAYTFTVTGENGGINEIEVRQGEVGIIHADCPDKLCVKQGFIRTSLLPITCLPNRLVICLRNISEAEPDIITY